MKKYLTTITILISSLLVIVNLYAYNDFKDYVNSPTKTEEKTKDEIRIDWEEFFGYDVFLPYFKLELFRKSIQTKYSFEYKNFCTRLETDNILSKNYSIYYKLIWRFN